MSTLNSNTTVSLGQTAQVIKEIWDKEIHKPFYKALQAAKLVNRDDGLVSAGGDLVRKPFLDTIDARAKSASTDVTFDVPFGTPLSYNIDKHYYSAVRIEKIAEVQSNWNLQEAFRGAQAEAVARQVDTDILGQYASVGTTVSGGASVDDADMLSVVAAFDAANTPMDLRRGIIGAGAKNDLLNVNKYVAYDQTGKTGVAVAGGMVSTVYDMDIYMSQNVPVSTTGREQFFHKSALSLAEQLAPTTETEKVARSLALDVVLHTIYGINVDRAGSYIAVTRTTAA
jgi:hypothetical protein